MSWELAWSEGRTGWDAGRSPPILEELVTSGVLPVGRAFVPGCGAGYDVFTLASPERTVVGLDVAPSASARFEQVREDKGVPAERARIVTGDFFTFEPDAPFDMIWDYTFLCALDPERRRAWAQTMERLLAPEGELVTLAFPVVDAPPLGKGPPFPLRPEHLRELLEPRWVAIELRPVERSHPGREGKEWIGRWRRA